MHKKIYKILLKHHKNYKIVKMLLIEEIGILIKKNLKNCQKNSVHYLN